MPTPCAITSDRVYRRGKSYQEAAQELDDWAGRQFDPKVVEAFNRFRKTTGMNCTGSRAPKQTNSRAADGGDVRKRLEAIVS